MLHELTSTYWEIAKYFPELKNKISSSAHKKNLLVEMAMNGEPRPSQKTKLGRALSEYTKPSSKGCCDPSFDRKIRELRPDWFLSQTQIADRKKKQLLDMAKNGETRPSHDKTRLGQALSNYTRKSSEAYDSAFDKVIRKFRPDWF